MRTKLENVQVNFKFIGYNSEHMYMQTLRLPSYVYAKTETNNNNIIHFWWHDELWPKNASEAGCPEEESMTYTLWHLELYQWIQERKKQKIKPWSFQTERQMDLWPSINTYRFKTANIRWYQKVKVKQENGSPWKNDSEGRCCNAKNVEGPSWYTSLYVSRAAKDMNINVSRPIVELLLLLFLKTVFNGKPGESSRHPISPKTPASQYQPIERKKRVSENRRRQIGSEP